MTGQNTFYMLICKLKTSVDAVWIRNRMIRRKDRRKGGWMDENFNSVYICTNAVWNKIRLLNGWIIGWTDTGRYMKTYHTMIYNLHIPGAVPGICGWMAE